MRADDGGEAPLGRFAIGDEEPGRHAVAGLRMVPDVSTRVTVFGLGFAVLGGEWHPALAARERSHDFLDMREDVSAADVPIARRFDRARLPFAIDDDGEIGMVGVVRGLRFGGVLGDHRRVGSGETGGERRHGGTLSLDVRNGRKTLLAPRVG